jgi:hypothetical protein
LSLGAAFIEGLVAWIVVSASDAEAVYDPWSGERLIKDVPIVVSLIVTNRLY